MKEYNKDIEVEFVFECTLCGFMTPDHAIMLEHLEENHSEEIGGQNPEYFISEVNREQLTSEELSSEASGVLEENPEETPCPYDEGMDEVIVKAVENYANLSEDEKKDVLAKVLGSKKEYPTKLSRDAVANEYLKMLNGILEDSVVCSICHKDVSNLSAYPLTSPEKRRMAKVAHIRTAHEGLWNILKSIFVAEPIEEREVDKTGSPNPEACSKERSLEKLSEILEDSEARSALIEAWIKSLQKRK